MKCSSTPLICGVLIQGVFFTAVTGISADIFDSSTKVGILVLVLTGFVVLGKLL